MRYYRLDLQADLGTSRLPYRRLPILLAHLPRDSAYVQKVSGPVALWGQQEHLLAVVADAVAQLNHNYVQAHSKRKLPPLKPLPRPGVTAEGDDGKDTRRFGGRGMSIVEFERAMAAHRRKGGKSNSEAVGGGDD